MTYWKLSRKVGRAMKVYGTYDDRTRVMDVACDLLVAGATVHLERIELEVKEVAETKE